MARPYVIQHSTEAVEDLAALRAVDRTAIRRAIEQHLTSDPTRVSRSRIKLMTQPFWAQYRLRVGEFRIYYDVDDGARRVLILRVLRKGTRPTPTEAP